VPVAVVAAAAYLLLCIAFVTISSRRDVIADSSDVIVEPTTSVTSHGRHVRQVSDVHACTVVIGQWSVI